MNRFTFATLGLILLILAPARAADWPQFLGPNRDAVSAETGLNLQWPAEGPPVLWTIETGPGFGGAAIRDGQVFLLDREEETADVLRVLDLASGKELWRYRYESRGKHQYPGSRSVPTVTEKHVFTVGGFGEVTCIDRQTHEKVWSFNLGQRYKAGNLNWGYAQSPLVYRDWVILSPTDGSTPALIAVEQATGRTVWESQPPATKAGRAGDDSFTIDYYSSPVLRTIAGRQGLLLITNHQVLFADPENGQKIWSYENYAVKWAIPSPTVLPNGHDVFVTGGYDAGSVMIHVSESGGQYTVTEKFRLPADGSQIHPAVVHGRHLYANINENTKIRAKAKRPEGGLACIDPESGKILWRTGEDPFFERGGFILAGDAILIVDGELGTLTSVQVSPDGFKPISTSKVLKGEGKNIWAPLALSNGHLVIRDQSQMKCLDLRKK